MKLDKLEQTISVLLKQINSLEIENNLLVKENEKLENRLQECYNYVIEQDKEIKLVNGKLNEKENNM
ncbi:MAG: hypothetical protein R3Y60_01785 [bacterium]